MIPKETADYLRHAFKKGKVVCLTGAGISVESGIPAFRGKGGLWERYDPQVYANSQGLTATLKMRPQDLVKFIIDFYSVILKARPNPAHLALSEMEKKGILSGIITQNIDNLHGQAGNRNVVELHGNAFRIRCMSCKKLMTLEKDRLQEMIESLKGIRHSRIKLLKALSRYFPRCNCGSRYRIDVVLFGEMLPQKELVLAYKHLDNCETLLIIGSSLVVYPVATLPLYAKEKGAKLIEINNEKSALSDLCDYRIRGKVSEVLPEILKTVDV